MVDKKSSDDSIGPSTQSPTTSVSSVSHLLLPRNNVGEMAANAESGARLFTNIGKCIAEGDPIMCIVKPTSSKSSQVDWVATWVHWRSWRRG